VQPVADMMPLAGIAIATLGGAAIGLERQWSGHATGPQASFGGIRTFTLLGVVSGIAGELVAANRGALGVVLLGACALIVAIGYAAKSRRDIDATTEVAALVVLTAGTLAGLGRLTLASGLIAATAVLLLEKGRLHTLVHEIDDATLRASARFAALALVILPLLPSGAYGPFGAVRPRELWALVLFFSGLSFAAWIARRLLGPAQGTVAAGILGGLISSTSVTLSFARASRAGSGARALAFGTIGACTVMLLRVTAASAILNWPVALAFLRYVSIAGAIGIVALVFSFIRPDLDGATRLASEESPLQLRAALQMTLLFQVVLIVVSAVTAWWSLRALLVTSALIGLTDLDALTLSLARSSGDLTPDRAAQSLAVGVLSNTLLKGSVAVVIGKGSYRVLAGAVLGAMAVAVAAALWA
jgi:uncharacterized membrane protein (DUF4010 family)